MEELQKRVIILIEAGEEPSTIAKALNIHRNTMINVRKLFE